jgi:hypothetical protein
LISILKSGATYTVQKAFNNKFVTTVLLWNASVSLFYERHQLLLQKNIETYTVQLYSASVEKDFFSESTKGVSNYRGCGGSVRGCGGSVRGCGGSVRGCGGSVRGCGGSV